MRQHAFHVGDIRSRDPCHRALIATHARASIDVSEHEIIIVKRDWRNAIPAFDQQRIQRGLVLRRRTSPELRMPEITQASAPCLEQPSRHRFSLDQVGLVHLERHAVDRDM